MDPNIVEQEKIHLNSVLKKVSNSKKRLEILMKQIGAENLVRLQELREDPQTEPHDLLFFMEQLQQKNESFNYKDKFKRLEEFNSLMNEPYFSRIDLQEKNSPTSKSFYIGKFGYTEKEPIVIDWRAKLASVYYRYRYPQKDVKYDTPNGVEIRDLTLKRTYEIDKGNLLKYYNNDIQLDETEIIVDKIQRRTGGVLEDIVETIQESQLDIIEADPRQVCVVQGCVGSGKTTVAIHKLSHIFFNYPELIHPDRSIIIAKNQILVSYLSTLFPKLGIFDTNYKSLREIVYNLIFREDLKLNVDFDLSNDLSHIDLDYINDLKEKINHIHNEYQQELDRLFAEEEFELWGGYVYSKKSSIYDNISEAIDDAEEELDLQKNYLKERPESVYAATYKENIKTLKKLINRLKRIRSKIKETTIPEMAKRLGIKTNDKLGYLETIIYIYLYSELAGLQNTQKFEYCVIDEGQDFNVLEYLIMEKLVINGRFCILGDLNQGVNEGGISKWDEISSVITEAKHANTFELDTNYRSTKPIIEFANKILNSYTSEYLPKSINRKGMEPEVRKQNNIEQLSDVLIKELKKDLNSDNKSIGVICFTPEHFESTSKIMENTEEINKNLIKLDDKKRAAFVPKGIYLTSFEDCKGLEFAKVYVLGLNLEKISSFKNAKKAYVAVTRAMNELHVLYV